MGSRSGFMLWTGTLAWPDLECADAWKSRIDSWRSVILVAPENSVRGSG